MTDEEVYEWIQCLVSVDTDDWIYSLNGVKWDKEDEI
jgi:hypothetical protein